jgi:Protein of unknown function (DUF3703)
MKFYWKMPDGLKVRYRQELEKYKSELWKGNLQLAWQHLERAHILGQPWPREHSHVHWIMLKFGVRIKNSGEILGQIPRLLIGGVKSFVGNIPVGNTGGANVPPLQPMEIPDDLKEIMKPYRQA